MEEDHLKEDVKTRLKESIKTQDIQEFKSLINQSKSVTASSLNIIHLACQHEFIEGIDYLLLEQYASLNDRDEHGNTPLHIACQQGHIELVRTHIEEIDHMTTLNNEGYTLLHVATAASQFDIILFLIDKGFDPFTYTTIDHFNALHIACKKGDIDIIKYLIDGPPRMDPKLTTKPSENKPGGQEAIHFAALHGHLHVLKYLIIEQGCDPNVLDNSGKTPTLLAGECGNVQVMKYLVEEMNCDPAHSGKGVGKVAAGRQALHGASFVGHLEMVQYLIETCNIHPHVKDSAGVTPLACAAQEGKDDVVDYLCGLKSDFNPNMQDSTGRTPLHYACLRGRESVVKILCSMDTTEVDILDNSAETCTIIACKNSHKDVVSYLVMEGKCKIELSLSSGRKIIDYSSAKDWLELVVFIVTELHANPEELNEVGLSPVHYAAEGNALSVLRYLLEERKCDPNIMSNEGDTGTTPLLRACMFGSLEVVEYLIKDRSCSLAITSRNKKMSPLHLACSGGHKEVVMFLLESCNHDLEPLNSQNAIPLHMAILNNHLEITRYLIDEHNSNPLRTTKGGATGFHAACQGGSFKILKYLLDHSRFSDFKDQLYYAQGGSPLDQAAEQGHLEIVRHLVVKGICNPQKRGDNGYTCLHWSAFKGRLQVVKFLLEETSCDLLAVNYNGQIPLHLAVSRIDRDHLETVKYLLSHDKSQLGCKDGNKLTPLQLVKNAKIYSTDGRELKRDHLEGQTLVSELLTAFVLAGADPDQMMEVEPASCNFMKSCIPLYSHTKVFLLGSTTTLMNEINVVDENSELTNDSAVPVRVCYKELKHTGEIMIYEISSSVTSFEGVLIDAIKSCESAVFVICIDLNTDFEDIGIQLNYWQQFISSLINHSDIKPVRILLMRALNINQSTDLNTIDQVSNHCLTESVSFEGDHIKLIGSSIPQLIICDQDFLGIGALKLIRFISKFYNSLQSSQPMELFPTAVRSLLLEIFRQNNHLAINLTELSNHIISKHIPLPSDLTMLATTLTSLTQNGHIIFIKNEIDIGESIIMVDPKLIFLKLYEAISLITTLESPSLTTVETIKTTCRDCAIHENDFIKLLQYTGACINVKDCVLIPSLLPLTPKTDVMIHTDHKSQYCLGWLLECDPPHVFTSPVCNHLPLLAASLLSSLPMNGSCNVWRGGAQFSHETMQITLTNLQGEAILLIIKDIRKNLLQVAKKRSIIIRGIFNLMKLYSPNISTQTFLLHPSCMTTMSLNISSGGPSLAAISVSDIFETLGQTEEAFNCSCEDLAGFEPLFILGQRFCNKFFNAENSSGIISPENRQHIVTSFTPYCQELSIILGEKISPILNSYFERTHCIVNDWIQKGEKSLRTYHELWMCLKPYSIFSDLSPP